MTETSDDIERQSDAHRAHVTGLIEELKTRLTAGEIVDEVLGSDTLHQVTRNFATQVKSNPLALAMIGGGLAWLILSERSPGGGALARKAQDAADKVKDVAASAADRTSSAMAGDGAAKAGEKVGATVETARARVSETAESLKDKGSQLLRNTRSGARLDRLAREQPLLLAGVGVAAGLLLGAALPLSDIENELLGEESDRFRAQAADMARQGVDKSKEAAQAAYDAAVDTLTEDESESGDEEPMPQVYKPDGVNPATRYPQ